MSIRNHHKNVYSNTAHIDPRLETMQMSLSAVEWRTQPWCIHNMENSTSNGCEQSKWSQTQKNICHMISFLENVKWPNSSVLLAYIYDIHDINADMCTHTQAHTLGEMGSDGNRPWGVFAGCWPCCFLIWIPIPYLWSRNNINTCLIGVIVWFKSQDLLTHQRRIQGMR